MICSCNIQLHYLMNFYHLDSWPVLWKLSTLALYLDKIEPKDTIKYVYFAFGTRQRLKEVF